MTAPTSTAQMLQKILANGEPSTHDPVQSKTEPFYACGGLRRTPPICVGMDRPIQGVSLDASHHDRLLAAPVMR
jgi:hypothetical protein